LYFYCAVPYWNVNFLFWSALHTTLQLLVTIYCEKWCKKLRQFSRKLLRIVTFVRLIICQWFILLPQERKIFAKNKTFSRQVFNSAKNLSILKQTKIIIYCAPFITRIIFYKLCRKTSNWNRIHYFHDPIPGSGSAPKSKDYENCSVLKEFVVLEDIKVPYHYSKYSIKCSLCIRVGMKTLFDLSRKRKLLREVPQFSRNFVNFRRKFSRKPQPDEKWYKNINREGIYRAGFVVFWPPGSGSLSYLRKTGPDPGLIWGFV
jgi:hypothetical protein